jgi:hypothetical protein
MLKNYLRKTHMRRGVLTESNSRSPHDPDARKMYFDVLLDNLKNSGIRELSKYRLVPIYKSDSAKNPYISMTIQSNSSKYPDLLFIWNVYEPMCIFTGKTLYLQDDVFYDEMKDYAKNIIKVSKMLDKIIPLIDDATVEVYGKLYQH